MWITPETRKLCPFTKFSWSYPYFNILNEKSLGTQHRISAVKNSKLNYLGPGGQYFLRYSVYKVERCSMVPSPSEMEWVRLG